MPGSSSSLRAIISTRRPLERRKNRSFAVVAIARKLAVLAWHLLTHHEPYRYARPATVETKLTKLRVSQQGRQWVGPGPPTASLRLLWDQTRAIGRPPIDDIVKQPLRLGDAVLGRRLIDFVAV
jgi:hypothetical protein